MKHAIIYVPGLGDSRIAGQQRAVRTWTLYDVKPELFQMNWADGELFQPKLQRLLDTIDSLAENGYDVSLVGVSAGASAVLNAYAARKSKVHGVVIICGKVNHPEAVSPALYAKNPAFKESMDRLPDSLDVLGEQYRKRILSIRPIADYTVPVRDTRIKGVKQGLIPTIGHVPSIAYGISLGAYKAIRFLKKLPNTPTL